ncbi:MAG: family 16 glycosylhydrolase [Akkermansiaceae bacterium]|nr:family 16 glycosylhydrolase [Akkermansiaceae bacterium]
MTKTISLLSAATFWMAPVACVPGSPVAAAAKSGVTVSATDFIAASDGVSKKGSHVALESGQQWFSFDAEIPVTGRYRVEVSARADSDAGTALNVEDYIHNKDGRNYDITSAMVPPAGSSFATVSKDGSPLQAGTHQMKLVSNGGPVSVESVTFTLIKEHELTPYTLKQNVEGDEWVLVWSDEFETDGPPDPKTWAYDFGNWGWGNREPQYYTENRLENARCEGGRLIIEARKDREDGGWSSARLTTRGRVSFLYGKLEFRAKTTSGDGNWAAIWMLGDDYRDEVSWPYCGEIDILENVGREIDDVTGDGRTHFSCHTRAYYFKQNNHISVNKEVPGLGGKFHDYALEWTPAAVKIFLDGEHVYTYDKTADELEYPFNRPQNLIINMAMGGGMGGEIDPSLERERMEVEYLRVYGRQ